MDDTERPHGGLLYKLSKIRFRTSENSVALFSDFLLGLGSLGVSEDVKEDGVYEISSYFPMETDLSSVMRSLGDYAEFVEDSVTGAKLVTLGVEHIDRSSWEVWKTVLTKVRAGERVVIVPPWEKHTPEAGGGNEINQQHSGRTPRDDETLHRFHRGYCQGRECEERRRRMQERDTSISAYKSAKT
jgi:hypothetical protein